jgi:hypothetical protein
MIRWAVAGIMSVRPTGRPGSPSLPHPSALIGSPAYGAVSTDVQVSTPLGYLLISAHTPRHQPRRRGQQGLEAEPVTCSGAPIPALGLLPEPDLTPGPPNDEIARGTIHRFEPREHQFSHNIAPPKTPQAPGDLRIEVPHVGR